MERLEDIEGISKIDLEFRLYSIYSNFENNISPKDEMKADRGLLHLFFWTMIKYVFAFSSSLTLFAANDVMEVVVESMIQFA